MIIGAGRDQQRPGQLAAGECRGVNTGQGGAVFTRRAAGYPAFAKHDDHPGGYPGQKARQQQLLQIDGQTGGDGGERQQDQVGREQGAYLKTTAQRGREERREHHPRRRQRGQQADVDGVCLLLGKFKAD